MKFERFCFVYHITVGVQLLTQLNIALQIWIGELVLFMSGMWPIFVASYVEPWFQHQLIASRWSSKGSFLYHITVWVQLLTELNIAIQLWIGKKVLFMSGMWPKFVVSYVEPWFQHQLIASRWSSKGSFLYHITVWFQLMTQLNIAIQLWIGKKVLFMSGMWPKFVASYVVPWFQHQLLASRWSSKGLFLYHITVWVQLMTQLNIAIQLWIGEHMLFMSVLWPKFVASYVEPWFQHQLIASRWSSKGSFLYHITVWVQPLTQLNMLYSYG